MIGFDIGGTKCSVCVGYEENGELVIKDKKMISTRHDVSAYELIDELCSIAEEMTDDFSLIGISCGGPLDSKRGVIMSPPNLPGWNNIKICEYIKKRFGGKVAIQNDANACAVAEWKYGAGKGCENMVFLTFGTGLGAGLILNNQLYTGASDMAGEVGHIRLCEYGPVGYGKSGSFEGFCSGNGIAELGKIYAKEQIQMGKSVSYCKSIYDLDEITAKKIAECAKEGYKDALYIYEECGNRLGQGLSIIIDILNPEMIVIGSVYQRSGELLKDTMTKVIKKECLEYSQNACRIVSAQLGDNIGDYAALAVAANIKEM